VTNDQLEKNFERFYQHLHAMLDFRTAWEQHLKEFTSLWDCQSLFFQMICGYVRVQCSSKDRKVRAERVLTKFKDQADKLALTQTQLQETRRFINLGLLPGQQVIDKYADIFLAGRQVAFNYDNVATAVRIRREKSKRG
jgi:hypothetical protein